MIKFEDFEKIEIRIGTVISSTKVEDSNNLIRLIIDFDTEQRQVITGMANFYHPDHFLGKQIPVLMNLKPRKIKGLESQGMILAVDGTEIPILLTPEKTVVNGAMIR